MCVCVIVELNICNSGTEYNKYINNPNESKHTKYKRIGLNWGFYHQF